MTVSITGASNLAVTARKACAAYHDLSGPNPLSDILWVCDDTPILAGGVPDVETIFAAVRAGVSEIRVSCPVVISSQVPSGFTARCEREWPLFTFICSPENVRVDHALDDFVNQSRIICGLRQDQPESDSVMRRLRCLFAPFTEEIVFVSPETAEMVKHALNGFLALSVAYANELNIACSRTGADMADVTTALRSDPRIGQKAYLRAGGPYGQHLEREVYNLNDIVGGNLPLIHALRESNERQKSAPVEPWNGRTSFDAPT